MKRIVAIVQTASETGRESENFSDPGHASKEGPQAEAGGMRLEVTVTDMQANKIVSTILSLIGTEPVPDATLDDLLQRELAAAGPDACDLYNRIVSRIEERLLNRVYAECHGVKTRAADRLGINRNTLHRMLQQHHLESVE